jgi:hypothetical protein
MADTIFRDVELSGPKDLLRVLGASGRADLEAYVSSLREVGEFDETFAQRRVALMDLTGDPGWVLRGPKIDLRHAWTSPAGRWCAHGDRWALLRGMTKPSVSGMRTILATYADDRVPALVWNATRLWLVRLRVHPIPNDVPTPAGAPR